jgi:hypothetical protein
MARHQWLRECGWGLKQLLGLWAWAVFLGLPVDPPTWVHCTRLGATTPCPDVLNTMVNYLTLEAAWKIVFLILGSVLIVPARWYGNAWRALRGGPDPIEETVRSLTTKLGEMERSVNARFLEESKTSTVPRVVGSTGASPEKWTVIYSSADGRHSDFLGTGAKNWEGRREIGEAGTGTFDFKDGILSIERTNTAGCFHVWLRRYIYGGVEKSYIEKNITLDRQRRFRVRCEAKVVDGSHSIWFTFRDQVQDAESPFLGNWNTEVRPDEWQPLSFECQFSQGRDCHLRIDERNLGRPSTSLQIRNLVLEEEGAESVLPPDRLGPTPDP